MTLNSFRFILVSLAVSALLGGQDAGRSGDLAKATARFQEAEALSGDRADMLRSGPVAKAMALAEEALTLREAALGPGHLEVARSLLQVGWLSTRLSQNVKAESFLVRAMATFHAQGDLREEGQAMLALGEARRDQHDDAAFLDWTGRALDLARTCGDQADEARALLRQGYYRYRKGDPGAAQKLLLQSLALQGASTGASLKGITLFYLGSSATEIGEQGKAHEYLEACLGWSRSSGNRYWEGMALFQLAQSLRRSGGFAAAIEPMEQALVVCRETGNRGGESQAHTNLGIAYGQLNQTDKARVHFLASMDLDLATGNLAGAGITLINLASVDYDLGHYTRGLASIEQALSMARKAGNRITEGAALTWMARFQMNLERLEEASASVNQALAIHRELKNERALAEDLRCLGEVLLHQGRAPEALPCLEQALALSRAGHQLQMERNALAYLARALHAAGRMQESTARFKETVTLMETEMANTFPLLSESQKLVYTQKLEGIRANFIAHALGCAEADPAAVPACFEAWLSYKGAVLDAQERVQQAMAKSSDPRVKSLATTLLQTRRQLAALTLSQSKGPAGAEVESQIKDLLVAREAQEGDLAHASRRFATGASAQRLDLAQLARLLPAGSAYLDFAKVPSFDFKNYQHAPARYAVFLLRPEAPGAPVLVDLGPAEFLDAQILALREAIGARRAVQEELAGLYRHLLLPLEAQLGQVTSFFISPAGALNLIPFELLGPNGATSLMDRGPVTYVTAGRDLARLTKLDPCQGPMVILDDPAFNLGLGAMERQAMAAVPFPRLPGTRQEARTIAQAFPKRRMVRLEGSQASDASLLAVAAPRVLHLATHGYFQSSQQGAQAMGLSGLALAGANTAMSRKAGPGLFSADQVMGLDLANTSLVVLSACNTGLGGLHDAEGVFGLRRAFVLAGAQTLVVSLWPVSDEDTRKLMGLFYRGLARGLSKSEALQQAKRAIRTLKPHPQDWAGFVLVGNPS